VLMIILLVWAISSYVSYLPISGHQPSSLRLKLLFLSHPFTPSRHLTWLFEWPLQYCSDKSCRPTVLWYVYFLNQCVRASKDDSY
jgi:hypothetical protein